jgi:hypothetical protein
MMTAVNKRTLVGAALLLVAFASLPTACSGARDESRIDLSELAAIVSAEPIGGTRVTDEVVEDEAAIGEVVRDTEFADDWKGGYRARYVQIDEELVRVDVHVDVYTQERAAVERAEAERQLNADFYSLRLSGAVQIEDIPGIAIPAECAGFALKLPGVIVPQYEVYCRTGTVVVAVRATSRSEQKAAELLQRTAPAITSGIEIASD